MGRVRERDSNERGALRTRAFGWLMLAGALLAGVTVALPPPASGSDAAVLAVGGACGAAGLALLWLGRALPEWVFGFLVALGTVLITLATSLGGPGATGTGDNEMLYVWICLTSFYFLALPHALLQLAGVGLAYGWLLADQAIPFDDSATRWIVTMATLIVAGLLIARLRGSLDRLVGELADRARLDSLTGLLNRRALEERAAVELARSRREGTSVGMLVADIDGFKTLNDTLGHPAGDRVLLEVACVLAEQTRDVDAVARVGGDEFAVLLPGGDGHASLRVAERLLAAINAAALQARLRLTLSIGVAVGAGSTHNLEALWQAADSAMYDAKRAGGSQVAAAVKAPRAVPANGSVLRAHPAG